MRPLEQDLERYQARWPEDRPEQWQRYRDFVESTADCCQRTHLAGHCTGSAFIVCPDFRRTLLLYHPFLQRWLQPGGHADGDPDLLQVATREASEETGLPLAAFQAVSLGADRTPFDLDIHAIPARKQEPAHWHYDLRFLLTTDPAAELHPESEEMLVEWVPLERVSERTDERSVLRMMEKVFAIRSIGPK
ncbi:MAG: NUDIX hydrolase [Vulcanimicrobiota bacterium]